MTETEAAEVVIDVISRMAAQDRPLMMRVLPEGQPKFWQHYPDQDARDPRTRSRWYYHVHAANDRDGAEHGHFHLFLHRTQMADGGEPLATPAKGEDAPAHVVHIAGLSIDQQGVPLSWFVTNRWVTDEFLYPANEIIARLDQYDVDCTPEDGLTNRLLTAMVALYREELADLLRKRDAEIARLAEIDGRQALEAGHAVLASCPIDLDEKISAVLA
ncbi:MAG: hypothetical protein GW768_13790 [Sphingomonadales bacterium]|nr:hypothetical protein [Sphingomonadales bacterium]NCT05000.1 hypothetical protein [Sphingomonadales bacterium]